MGKLEKNSALNTRKKNIQKIILNIIAVTGMLAVAFLAPNVLGAMSKLGIIPKKRQTEIIKRSKERLLERGLIKLVNGHFELTLKGKIAIDLENGKKLSLTFKKKWDKKWRVLIFDIPERMKILRNKVRLTLVGLGFMRLQDSVWVFPYDCEDLITLLKIDFKVGKNLIYMIVEEIENDKALREFFGL